MRLHSLLALTGTVLLVLPACTSDLPAPFCTPEQEEVGCGVGIPPPPPNELAVDCSTLPFAATGARYAQTPTITGLVDGSVYRYSVTSGELPATVMLDEDTGELVGLVEADPGTFTFDILVEDVGDPENYNASSTCTLEVRPRLDAPLALDAVPFCLNPNDDLRSLVIDGTGDGTPITCDYTGGNGNGRLPNGMEVDSESCIVTGDIDESRYGTWVFMMRGTQSGAEVFVPYCVTNDEAQGYEITASHSGNDDAALLPIMRTYDPTAAFDVGSDGDPRYEVTSPGTCGGACFYRYEFLRTNAPIGDSGFTLDPDGLVQNDMMESVGFFHELRVNGPAVPQEFLRRPWVLSVAVSYCISGDENGCDDVATQGDGALEMGLIMVPN